MAPVRDGLDMWHVWRKGEVCTRCWWGNLKERDHWGDQDIDGRIILMNLQEVGGGCVGWMELAQDRDRWRALASTVMNCGVP
jgi:hypothetical protein